MLIPSLPEPHDDDNLGLRLANAVHSAVHGRGRCVQIDRLGVDILSITGDAEAGDDTDYLRVCPAHHWASERTVTPEACSHCPACQLALTGALGEQRYTRLLLAVVRAAMTGVAQ